MSPVVEIMYMDFVTCAMDEVVNQAAKMRYMTGGQASVPMVIRLPCGVGRLLAAPAFADYGIVVYARAGFAGGCAFNAERRQGVAESAVRSPDPVLFFEYKRIYTSRGEVPDGEHIVPIGKADISREGEDATIVAVDPWCRSRWKRRCCWRMTVTMSRSST